MALVSSPIRFSSGSLHDISFFTDKRGRAIARMKPKPNMDFHTHPKLIRCRENALDFGAVSKAAGHIRGAFHSALPYCSDGTYFNRLVGLLRVISSTDAENLRGACTGYAGNINLLTDFQFNKDRSLAQAMDADFTTRINAATGEMSVEFESFIPLTALKIPAGAKYFQLVATGSSVGKGSHLNFQEVTDLLPLNSRETGSIKLDVQVAPKEGEVLLLGVGVVFYEEYLQVPLPLRGGAMAIVEVKRSDLNASSESSPQDREALQKAEQQKLQETMQQLQLKSPPGVLTGSNLRTLVPDYAAKVVRLQQHLWLQRLNKYRHG